jgi:hypothetical protein
MRTAPRQLAGSFALVRLGHHPRTAALVAIAVLLAGAPYSVSPAFSAVPLKDPQAAEYGATPQNRVPPRLRNGPSRAAVARAGELPFTGFDVLVVLGIGIGLVAAAIVLRRLSGAEP